MAPADPPRPDADRPDDDRTHDDRADRAEVVHRLPDRVRLRLPTRRGQDLALEALAERVGALAGVRAVRANPRTGTLVIHFDGPWERLATLAADRGLFQVRPRPPVPTPPSAGAAGGVPGFKGWATAGLVGLGLMQASRGELLGPATTLFWYAATLAARSSGSARDGTHRNPDRPGAVHRGHPLPRRHGH